MTELSLRTATLPERMYSYSQSQQISMQSGLIGYLRADMGTNGNGFFCTWNDFRNSINTDEFKAELDEVINSLREDGNVLSNRNVLSKYCNSHPESAYDSDFREFGFRADTAKHAYILRLNPNKGEYNLYCYCYVREWLDNSLHRAEKGIRFINSSYKEQFRISDGDTVRITYSDGKSDDRQCRYIDEYHLEVGRNLYHICEFAERMEEAESTVIPIRSSLPERCYGVLPSTGELIILVKGESGFYKTEAKGSKEQNSKLADKYNDKMGISKAKSEAMLAGSMFGWGVPAADPKSYSDDGRLINSKSKERGDAR